MSDADTPLNLLTRRFLDGLPTAPQAGRLLHRAPDGSVVGDWNGLALGSAFQDIVESMGGRQVGREALLRALAAPADSRSPWQAISAYTDDHELIALDRLARTLHLLNALTGGHDGPLFMNVNGRLLSSVGSDHGRAFRRVIEALGLLPEQIVIETPVEASAQPDLLHYVLRNYRYNGFQVAINVESPAQWAALVPWLGPGYVKIDARRLGADDRSPRDDLQRLLERRQDAVVIVTHIEHDAKAFADEGVLHQGFAIRPPQRLVPLPSLARSVTLSADD